MMKPLALLTHMPLHIQETIVEHTDTFARVCLRKCTPHLRYLVDHSTTHYSSISLKLNADGVVVLELEGVPIEFHSDSDGCLIRKEDVVKVMKSDDYIELAVAEFASFVRNSSSVNTIRFEMDVETSDVEKTALLNHIQKTFSEFEHKLNVFSLIIGFPTSSDQLFQILNAIQPGTLDTLSVEICDGDQGVQRLIDTEHWKLAKRLHLEAPSHPIKEMAHFREIHLIGAVVSLEDVKLIVESALQHGDHYEKCSLERVKYTNLPEIHDSLSEFRTLESVHETYYHIDIPNSDSQLEIMISENMFCVGKAPKGDEDEQMDF